MRKLVVFRGHQGSGKSYTIDALGLNEWTLSSDVLRSIVASPMLTTDGRMIINQDVNHVVFTQLRDLAEARMRRGETLVIDTTGFQIADFDTWREMAKEHRYQIAFVDLSGIPLETALARQEGRHDLRKVPLKSLERFMKVMKDNPLTVKDPERETLIVGDDVGSHIEALRQWLEVPVLDLSAYKSVVHIGDLQGCHSVVVGRGGPLEHGFRDDTFYVFVGDLLDRGIENGKVLRWFVDEALGRDNVALLHGNHEDHLHRWSRGLEAVSNEFAHRTLPQLIEEGLTPADADAVCDKAREFLIYDYQGRRVFVNHAGLSTLPTEPWRVSLEQYSRGTGQWSDDVDGQYAALVKNGVYQVHGHRNDRAVSIRANSLSFNLEDSVEHGGCLRTCTLSSEGWTTQEYRNRVFRPLAARIALEHIKNPSDNRAKARKRYPEWITKQEPSQTVFDPDLLAQMKEHSGVNQKFSSSFPHIFSLNFSRNVFFDKAWDDVVVKARGLFLDDETSVIAARGYDKFFNIGELPSTQIEALADSFHYPVQLYMKENGFLGNLGYDERRDTLMIASKSTSDGDFAGWFRDILADTLTEQSCERLRRYLRDTESSMTFEVNDPVNDPHIIEYDNPHIVLLDVVRRSTDFRKASYDVVREVGDFFGLEVKQKAMRFESKIQLLAWYRKVENDMSHQFKGKFIEGYVFEDASGFMTKWKSPYYKFWKQMRSQHMRVRKMLENSQMPKNAADNIRGREWMSDEQVSMAVDFNGWLMSRTPETIGDDIVSARKMYIEDRDLTPSGLPHRVLKTA